MLRKGVEGAVTVFTITGVEDRTRRKGRRT
jgi:hypothetical protein